MSRADRITNERVWMAVRDAYSSLLANLERLMAEETDPAMLLAAHKIRDELRESHRGAVRRLGGLRPLNAGGAR